MTGEYLSADQLLEFLITLLTDEDHVWAAESALRGLKQHCQPN